MPAPKTSAPGHSRHPPDKPRTNNARTGAVTANGHAGLERAVSQDFRILTNNLGRRLRRLPRHDPSFAAQHNVTAVLGLARVHSAGSVQAFPSSVSNEAGMKRPKPLAG